MQPIPSLRPGRRVPAVPIALAALAALTAPATADPADSARAIWSRGEQDSAHAFLDGAIDRARAAASADLGELLRLQGAMYTAVGIADRGIPPLEEALALAEARGDSAEVLETLRWLAPAHSQRGELDEGERLAERWKARAEDAGLDLRRCQALSHLGWIAMQRNQTDKAARILEEVREELPAIDGHDARRTEATVAVELGNVRIDQGRYADARVMLEEGCSLAEQAQNLWTLGHAENDLGFLAFFFGDLDEAAARFEAAVDAQRRDGNDRDAIGPLMNRALLEAERGRYDEARARLRECVDLCENRGFGKEAAQGWSQLAEIRLSIGDPDGALEEFRRALQAYPAASLADHADIARGEVEALLARGDAAGADSLATAEDRTLRTLAGVNGLAWTRVWARTRRTAGDPGAAVSRLETAAEQARVGGLSRIERRLLHELALCEIARGNREAAMRRFEEAAAAWEAERRTPRDAVWNEQATADAHVLFEDWIDAVLAENGRGERAARAWSILQRYKARTLLERIHAPGGEPGEGAAPDSVPPVHPADALRDGETLLDLLLGKERAFVFVVDSSGVRAARRDSAQVEAFRNACREASDDLRNGSASPRKTIAVLVRFLGGEEGLPPAARILSPDGPADLVPWEGLDGPDGRPLAAFRVPSAAFLARVRRSGRTSGDGVTVVEGDSLPDGTELVGARREAQELQGMLADVRVVCRVDLDSLAVGPPRVLHVAAHTFVDDAVPWRSGIYLPGRNDETGGPDPWLRAERISRARIPAGLVVLSGCDTARGAVLSGEGTQGLATAFLAAGAPVVVAALGGVEDQAMATAIRRLYHGLARGRTIAEALAEAREASDGAEARALAGLAIVGDGARTVPLHERRPWEIPAAGLLALAGLLGWTWTRRGRRAL